MAFFKREVTPVERFENALKDKQAARQKLADRLSIAETVLGEKRVAAERPSASSHRHSAIFRRSNRPHPIDIWSTSTQTPPRLTWIFGTEQAHRRWRDRSATPRDRHPGSSSNAGKPHRLARWPASGGSAIRTRCATSGEQLAAG